MKASTTRTKRALSLVLAALVATAMLSGSAAAAGPTALTVSADDTTLAPGETTTVTLAIDDANGGVGSADFRVELSDPAVASVTGVQVANDPPSSTTSVDVDSDGAGATVSYALADSSADTGTVTVATVTLTADAEGSTDLNVVANPGVGALDVGDESGQSYTLTSVGSASITVADQNTPPVADAGEGQSVTSGDTVSLNASGSDDADGDALTYQWNQTAGTPSVSLSDTAAAQPTFTAPAVNTATTLTFEVEVSDGTDTDTDTVDVAVSPDAPVDPNQPPTADAGGNQVADENTPVSLDASGSNDPDGDDSLSYSWTQTDGTPQVTLADSDTATPSFTAPDIDGDQTLTFEVTVSDGNDSDTDTVDVTITDTDDTTPPGDGDGVSLELVGADGDGEIAVGSTTTYDVVVTGVDGGVGAFSATVSLADTDVATLTDASVAGGPESGDVSTTEVNVTDSAVTMEAAVLDTNDDGNVTLGTVEVTAAGTGSTDLDLSVSAIGDENGTSYAVTGTQGATLSVVAVQQVPGGEGLPTDGDDDGLYEDVNGDGNVTVADVQTLWDNRNDPAITDNAEFYDFNGDGSFDVVDVQALWNEIVD
jgi:hypothetical protein